MKRNWRNATLAGMVIACVAIPTLSAQTRKEIRFTVGQNPSVTVVNLKGQVTVKGGPGRQVVIVATTYSDKVEIASNQNANRIEVWTHSVGDASNEERRVEYEVTVPQTSNVNVRAAGGPIRAERLRGDVTLEGDHASVEARDLSQSHVHIRTLSGHITLANIVDSELEVRSLSGNVSMSRVIGPKMRVTATRGNIFYDGDFGTGGDYALFTHSGNIEVSVPEYASVSLTARSDKGAVQNEVPMVEKERTPFSRRSGSSFAGTSHSGSSLVQLLSISGTIRVKKQ